MKAGVDEDDRKQLTVCHVVSSLMYGGGQRVALDLVSHLGREPALKVGLILVGDRVADGLPLFDVPTTRVMPYDGRYNSPLSLVRAARALRRALGAAGADIVHSHGWDCNVIAGIACAGRPVIHVVHQHTLADWASSRRLVHVIRRGLTRIVLGSDRATWVAVSRAVKDSLADLTWLPPDVIRVIWNGIDIDRFRPAVSGDTNRTPVIGVAARLVPLKGLEFLIEAMALLRFRGVAATLRVAGDGPLRNSIAALAESKGVGDRVALIGQLENVEEFYRSLDVFAFPSLSEGLPLAVLEAMGTGLPVVATSVSGIPEAVRDGETGNVVAPRNAVALADALERLIGSAPLRGQMGMAGRRRAQAEFSLARTSGQIASLYQGLSR